MLLGPATFPLVLELVRRLARMPLLAGDCVWGDRDCASTARAYLDAGCGCPCRSVLYALSQSSGSAAVTSPPSSWGRCAPQTP